MTREELHRLVDELSPEDLPAAARYLKSLKDDDDGPRGTLQRLLTAVLPERLAASVEEESRAWIMRCPEGHEQSVWEAGGVRWKAAGEPRVKVLCKACGQVVWHTLHKR